MAIPFLDLRAHHAAIQDEALAAIREVIEAGAFAGGPFVERFEKDFAEFCGAPHAIGVGSGTDALWLALLALGVGPGDEVITVPSTFMATAEAISYTGAKPVFVDIDPVTYTMDPGQIEEAVTYRTKAIIPVHLFGQMADMDPIMGVAEKHGLAVIEDACQAHGAEYKGRKAGTIGVAGCFSFYPGKNLGAFGEAGAVTTWDPELREAIQMLRDHGQSRKYHHDVIGWNGRMDGIQGAVLRIKLRNLAACNDARRRHAREYDALLGQLEEVVIPREAAYARHVYHLYAVRVQNRAEIIQELGRLGVQTGIHYPIPVHLQKAYQFLGYEKGDFPVAERCAEEFLSLPMFPELAPEQVVTAAQELRCCIQELGPVLQNGAEKSF